MAPPGKRYDPECFKLAYYFLRDSDKPPMTPTLVEQLANEIQDTIEGFFLMHEDD